MKIRKGDNVKVIAGKNKGKTGKVIQVLPGEGRIVIDGVNRMYKHAKSRQQGEQGQKIDFFAPIDVSNVMLVSPKSDQPTRVGYKVIDNGKKVRIDRKSGESID